MCGIKGGELRAVKRALSMITVDIRMKLDPIISQLIDC